MNCCQNCALRNTPHCLQPEADLDDWCIVWEPLTLLIELLSQVADKGGK